ncbi:hypothetical protein [Diaphorobacter sp.]|uniref:hypothetical protein n=1 Tax=Diaphorobacter sp. TaxID=1934310 RepID=UPI0028AF588F|nr:hypothetical protein [Diaphorobacter sp.]
MPKDANTYGADEAQINTKKPQKPGDTSTEAKLPAERDESVSPDGAVEQPEMKQAYKDVKKGLVDTDERGPDGMPTGSDEPTQ